LQKVVEKVTTFSQSLAKVSQRNCEKVCRKVSQTIHKKILWKLWKSLEKFSQIVKKFLKSLELWKFQKNSATIVTKLFQTSDQTF